MIDNPEPTPDSPFGKFQESQSKRPEVRQRTWGNRYDCEVCGDVLMSDEALQLHKQNHLLASLCVALDKIRVEGIPVRLASDPLAH